MNHFSCIRLNVYLQSAIFIMTQKNLRVTGCVRKVASPVVACSLSVFPLCAVFQSPWWSTVTLWGAFSVHPCEKHTRTKLARSLLDANASQETMRGFLLIAVFLLPLVSSFWAFMCAIQICRYVCLRVCGFAHRGVQSTGMHIFIHKNKDSHLHYIPPVPQLRPGLFLYAHFCWCVWDEQ